MKHVILLLSSFLILSCQSQSAKDTDQEETNPQSTPTQQAPATETQPTSADSLSRQISQSPEDAQLYVERANRNLRLNRMQQAFLDINQALELDSNLATAHEALGEYFFAINKTREARDAWQRCLKLNPKNENCLLKLAELMIAVQDYEKALKLVNQQLDNNDKDPDAYFLKGIILRDKYRDTATALQYFQNALDLKQDFVNAWDMMGTTLLQQGDTMARFYFDRVLEMQPNRDDVYHKLGIYYMNNNQPNRAMESYTKALQLNPNNDQSLYNMGYMLTKLDEIEQAREYFSKAIQVGDRDYKSYFGRGLTYEIRGDLINARRDYRKALDELPVFKPAQEALGRVNKLINEQNGGQ